MLIELVNTGGLVLVALVNGVFLWLTGKRRKEDHSAITGRIRKIEGGVNTAVEQVRNSHGTNLRDDMDKTHKLIERIADQVDDVADDVREVRRQANRLFALDRDKGERIGRIEHEIKSCHQEQGKDKD